jgi:putative phage-type endonuclease
MNINNLINIFFGEYKKATFITDCEYRRLLEICEHITKNTKMVKWHEEELKDMLPPIIYLEPLGKHDQPQLADDQPEPQLADDQPEPQITDDQPLLTDEELNTANDSQPQMTDRQPQLIDRSYGKWIEIWKQITDDSRSQQRKPELLKLFYDSELKGEQGSDIWLKARNEYITASVSAACAGLMGKVARENQVLEKASYGRYRSFKGNRYTEIGNMYEEVTNKYYSYINKNPIYSFNLIPNKDEEYYFMAASTDGITANLINIEIKTLVSRAINPNKIKKEYYHQMQHQMECLKLDETDFIEVIYKEYPSLSEAKQNCLDTNKIGIIVEYIVNGFDKPKYLYSEIGDVNLEEWEQEKKFKLSNSYVRSIYWVMTDYLCRRILKDGGWIKKMGPELKKFWDEVIELRSDPYKLQKKIDSKKKNSYLDKCLI